MLKCDFSDTSLLYFLLFNSLKNDLVYQLWRIGSLLENLSTSSQAKIMQVDFACKKASWYFSTKIKIKAQRIFQTFFAVKNITSLERL